MEYTSLTPERMAEMLAQRLAQYEQEHYNHAVNKELLMATGATDQQTLDAIAAADSAMAVLDKAHAEVKKKMPKDKGQAA